MGWPVLLPLRPTTGWRSRPSPRSPPRLLQVAAGLHLAPAAQPVPAAVDVHPAAVVRGADSDAPCLLRGQKDGRRPGDGPQERLQALGAVPFPLRRQLSFARG